MPSPRNTHVPAAVAEAPGREVYPPRLLRYVAAVVAAAVPTAIAAFTAVAHDSPGRAVLFGVGACTLATLAAELKPVPLDETGTRIVSLAFVFILACQILYGWEYAAVVALVSTVLVQAVERAPLVKASFNAAVWVLAALASSIPDSLLGLHASQVAATDAARLTVLAVTGGLAYIAVNVTLVSVAIALQMRVPLRGVLDSYLREAGAAFAVMALVAALAASLWKLSPGLEPLLAGPLFALALSQRYARRSALAVRAAETDGLTGLGNHRSFQTALADVLASAADGEQRATLCLIDLDDFKIVNDRYGHPTGDRVLVGVADLLQSEFDGERAFRIGGEEFAVLLDGAAEDESRLAIERFHQRLAQARFPHGEPITISAGIASFPDAAGDRDELLRVADGALYWAKHHGKNRSCVYTPGVVPIHSPQELARTAERTARLRAAESLIRVVDAKDTYAGTHSQSVSRLVEGIARELGLDGEVANQIRLAGLLHDLGKIAIPDRILQKPSPLDAEELKVMREHAELGCRLVEGLGVSPIDRWIRHHHEWWDGSGYPDGLAGDEIPLGSRVILVADSFDAMTSDRSYRAAGSVQAAIEELRLRSWTQFDGRIVAALERHLEATGRVTRTERRAAV